MNTTFTEQERALRRAIMRVIPDYYSWPREEQERYRLTMSAEDRFRIYQVLLKDREFPVSVHDIARSTLLT